MTHGARGQGRRLFPRPSEHLLEIRPNEEAAATVPEGVCIDRRARLTLLRDQAFVPLWLQGACYPSLAERQQHSFTVIAELARHMHRGLRFTTSANLQGTPHDVTVLARPVLSAQ